MKKYLPILIVTIALLLTACMSSMTNSTTAPTTTQPTTTPPNTTGPATTAPPETTVPPTTVPPTTASPETTVPTDPGPTTVSQDNAQLKAFNELFKMNKTNVEKRNPYFWATGCEYASAKDVKLIAFFDGGFLGEHEKTDAEWAELSKMLNHPEFVQGDFNRLPKDKMNAELQAVFGISLEDLPDSAFDQLYYLESTDCYYFFQSGMTSVPVILPFLDLEYNGDGTISLTYTTHADNDYVITLKPNGDSYQVLSNLKAK